MNIINKLNNNKGITFLFTLLVVIIVFSFLFNKKMFEGYSNLANPGEYPSSVNKPLLSEEYPFTGRNEVSKNSYSNIWWHYPIFGVGSYAQITNNLRYRRNPDDGVCVRAEFCGALYKDNQLKSNLSKPLPPAPTITPETVRVGYYITNSNLLPGVPLGPELPAY